MFRQDRTNPATAISNWKGRRDTPRAWPSTAVSTWLNGSLFGAAVIEATGGTIIDHGGYRHHYFTASGDFVVSANPGGQTVDLVLAAGGGGGSQPYAGGAGEGLNPTAVACPPATYAIVIGAGGAYNTIGVASTAFSLTADPGTAPQVGASDRAGDSGSGNLGGAKDPGISSSGGGGGGQGGAGSAGAWQAAPYWRANGGPGGAGLTNPYYQTAGAPYVGLSYVTGGGGGGAGGWYASYISYQGNGTGGGGRGGYYSGSWIDPLPATANSGGGGGGKGHAAGNDTGLGGSGFFIVRYALDGS